MGKRRHKAKEILAKLQQVKILMAQGRPVLEAVRSIGVAEVTCYRWRSECGGLKGDEVKRLKEREAENNRMRRAVSDLTMEKLTLKFTQAPSYLNQNLKRNAQNSFLSWAMPS
jgi:hypothetical protein